MFAAAHVWKVGWPTWFSNLHSIGACFCNTHRRCPSRDVCMFQTACIRHISNTVLCMCQNACTPCIFTTVINILSTFTISSFLACHGRTSFTTVFIWPQAVLEAKVLAKALDSWRNCVNMPEKSSIMPAKNNYKACYCRSYKTDIFHLWFSTWLWYLQ